jgi:hypothetical protein
MQSPNLCWNRDAVEQARSSPTLNFFPLSLFSPHLFGAEFDLINLVIYLKDCKAARDVAPPFLDGTQQPNVQIKEEQYSTLGCRKCLETLFAIGGISLSLEGINHSR